MNRCVNLDPVQTRDSEPPLPIDPLLSLAHTIASAPGTQAVLLGSGVSRSARVPTGWEVTLDLVRRVAVLGGVTTDADPMAWYQRLTGFRPIIPC